MIIPRSIEFENITRLCALTLILTLTSQCITGQHSDAPFAVKGLCIAAPAPQEIDRFIHFMENDFVENGFNTLILRVEYNYEYQSYPQVRSDNPLTRDQVKKLVKAAQDHKIDLIPQVNLLGHQSWASKESNLLREFPEFDETPHVELPEKYEWPNKDGLYCKSYCPLHPDLHGVVFALVDEIMEVFEATSFHAGMDEVFYIADDQCPRCAGKDKARLFADEVTKINDHLKQRNWKLWIWGDRLLDGETTGLGMWEASDNETYAAVDWIPKDVIICDWHYENSTPTAAYFALKGFNVVTCPWNKPQITAQQIDLMNTFKKNANNSIESRYLGMVQTVWTSASSFLDLYYEKVIDEKAKGQVDSFNILGERFN